MLLVEQERKARRKAVIGGARTHNMEKWHLGLVRLVSAVHGGDCGKTEGQIDCLVDRKEEPNHVVRRAEFVLVTIVVERERVEQCLNRSPFFESYSVARSLRVVEVAIDERRVDGCLPED